MGDIFPVVVTVIARDIAANTFAQGFRQDACIVDSRNTGELNTASRHLGDARRSGAMASVPTSSSEPLHSRNI